MSSPVPPNSPVPTKKTKLTESVQSPLLLKSTDFTHLHRNINKYQIECRVLFKSAVIDSKMSYGAEGNQVMFFMTLLDIAGTKLKATVSVNARSHHEAIKVDNVISITKMFFSPPNTKFNNTGFPMEIHFGPDTTVLDVTSEHPNFPRAQIEFNTIPEVKQMTAKNTCNDRGTVLFIDSEDEWRGVPFKSLFIADENDVSIKITMWDKKIMDLKPKDRIVIYNGVTVTYKHATAISVNASSDIQLEHP
ncbi:hypothetical protein TKK_0011573 [Trichogramma kaykai]